MNRFTRASAIELVREGMEYVPVPFERFAPFDLLTEDPNFVGLHDYREMSYGRSYRNTAHVSWRQHSSDRSVTMVLPGGDEMGPGSETLIAHEFAHVLDDRMAERGIKRPAFAPVTWYAASDDLEAFAESFVAWLYPGDCLARMNFPYAFDRDSRAWWDALLGRLA